MNGLTVFAILVPQGMALGAAVGALGGSLTDVGIDEAFINQVREKVTEGTSALFLLESGARWIGSATRPREWTSSLSPATSPRTRK